MDFSIWWVVGAAALGLWAGMLLFAVLSVAADRREERLPDEAEPQSLT